MEKDLLPPCPLKIIRDYLESLDYNRSDEFSTNDREFYISEDGFDTVMLNTESDPMLFSDVNIFMEVSLKKPIHAIPFYAREIEQRFSPDGSGPSC